MRKLAKSKPRFKTRGEAAAEEKLPRLFAQASEDDMEAMMIGYRIASNEPRETWKDKLAAVPERLLERVKNYLRWAWARDTKDDFEVHP